MQVKEDQEGNYICLKHNQIVKMVVLDEVVNPSDLFLCDTCLDQNRSPYRMIRVNNALEMIQEKLHQNEETQKELLKLQNCEQALIELRSSILKAIDDIYQVVQNWIADLNNKNGMPINIVEGLKLLQQCPKKLAEERTEMRKSYLGKMDSAFKRLQAMDDFQQFQQKFLIELQGKPKIKIVEQFNQIPFIDLLKQLKQKTQLTQQISKKKQGPIKLKKVNSIKQTEECCAIAFNNIGNIMITGFKGNVKVWQFNDGSMYELSKLEVKSDLITCLIYSKKNQWFVLGDNSGGIQLWKQGENNSWLASNYEKIHSTCITCIILNQKENQIISSCCGSSISVMQVDYEQNKLQYYQILERIHDHSVYGLSLNESETALVSCGQVGEMLYWTKGTNQQWQLRNSCSVGYHLTRISFVSENELVVSLWGQGYFQVFKIINNELKLQEDQKINEIHAERNDDYLFPTIYNKRNEIIIQKSGRYVYILRREKNGSFKVQTKPIYFESELNYGSLSEDGQHLVVWTSSTKEFRIYKLDYE